MFGSAIKQFSANLDALRDFVNLVAPFLFQKNVEETKRASIDLAPLRLVMTQLDPEGAPLDEAEEQELRHLVGDEIEVEIQEEQEPGRKTFSIKLPSDAHDRFMQAVKALSRRHYHVELLYGSSLISLVSAAEWFLSQILHQYFHKFPGSMEGREKLFSLEDLEAIGSIEEAKAYIIDSCIEKILRGSIEDWLEFLKTKLKLSMGYLQGEKPYLIEICERRNLLIHNGGVVNGIYLSKTPAELREGISLGDHLDVSESYLDAAISRFERSFVLIAGELWKKVDRVNEERAPVLIDIAYNHLCAERWDIAESLSYFTMHDRELREVNQLIGTINYWQSLKWQDRFDEVREDIEATDFSAKDELFRLAQLALLDKEEEFFELLPGLLNSGKLSLQELAQWPLFRKIRETNNYKEDYQGALGDLDEEELVSVRNRIAS